MKKEVKNILIYGAIFSLINNIAHPVTPKLIIDKGFDKQIFGYLLSAMAFGSMISAPFWGKLWDKFQNKWIIILPYSLFYSLGQYLFSISNNEYSLLMSRAFSGLFASGLLYAIIPAILAAHSKKENAARNQVFLFAIWAFFANIGYGVGGIVGDYIGSQNTIALQALLVFLSIIPGGLLVKSIKKSKSSNKWEKDHPNIIECVCNNFYKNKLYHFLIPLIPFFMLRMSLGKFFDLQLLSNGYKTSRLGVTVMIMGMISVLFMFTIGQKMVKKYNGILLTAFMLTFVAIPPIVASYFKNITFLVVAFTISRMFIPLVSSGTASILVSKFPHKKGEVMGIRKAAMDFGTILGPIVFGLIYVRFNWLTFGIAGFILIPTIVLFTTIHKYYEKRLGGAH